MSQARRRRPTDESGFTFIEVLVSTVVLGVMISGVAAAIVIFFRTADGTASRLALSHDSQLLAAYLTPDLANLPGGGQPSYTSSVPGGCSSGVSFSDLQITSTDLSSQTPHTQVADYKVSGSVITRTFSVDGGVPPGGVTRVVHNLKDTDTVRVGTTTTTVPRPDGYYACLSGTGPWTVSVTTETANDPTTDYNFAVTGGGRVNATSAPAGAAPALCDPSKCGSPALLSHSDNTGRLDEIIATFDQPLNPQCSGDVSQWALSGMAGVTPQTVTVSGNQAILHVSSTTIDTAASNLRVALNGMCNGANQRASTGLASVADGMPPVPLPNSIVVQDTNINGHADQVTVTFSEAVQPNNDPAQWTLSGLPGAVVTSVNPVANMPNTLTLTLSGSPVDTIASLFTVALMPDPAGIQDLSGNLASFSAVGAKNLMVPAPVSIVSKDSTNEGKIDQIVMTFSEPLVHSTDRAPWRLTGAPPNVTLRSVDVTGSTVTLYLNEGPTVDTAATGMQVSLLLDDDAVVGTTGGHIGAFGAKPVSDGMGPVVIAMSTSRVNGGTAGKLDAGDTLTLVYSEPVSPLTVPATVTLTPADANTNDTLTIAGLATIDLGTKNAYVTNAPATFSASFTAPAAACPSTAPPTCTPSAVVTVTVGAIGNPADAGNVRVATGGRTIKVTPAATLTVSVTDLAGNTADGTFTTTSPVLF